MQYVKKDKKFEGVRIYDPKQTGICVTHQFKGHDFNFFNNKRGCLIGKGLKPSLDMKGNTVTDYGWEDVVEHFKAKGFKVQELDLDGKVKKAVKVEAPTPSPTISTPKVEEKKEDKK